jgi:lipoprotein signal peptidase
MNDKSYRRLFWALALLGVLTDQATKYGVFAWLRNDGFGSSRVVVPGYFNLEARYLHDGSAVHPMVNPGALFGFGGEHRFAVAGQSIGANSIFAVVSILAAFAVVWWSTRKSTAGDWSLCAALGLILGGTTGNLYDRLVFNGVRDFLHWYGWFEWPVFNVADCCLVLGAFLLLGQAFLRRQEQTEEPPASPPAALHQEVAKV